jgi:hypothetical protein
MNDDQPADSILLQLTFGRSGEPDVTMTLSAADLGAHLAALTIAWARHQPIADSQMQRLAGSLGAEGTDAFEREIYATIIGTVLAVLRGWNGPRHVVDLLKKIGHRQDRGPIAAAGQPAPSGPRLGLADLKAAALARKQATNP